MAERPQPGSAAGVSAPGELLEERARSQRPWDIRLAYVGDDRPPGSELDAGDGSAGLTFGELYDLARGAAAHLQARGVERGDRVLLILPTGASYLAAFFGCQVLGAIPVPVVPPWSIRRLHGHVARIAEIARITRARATVLTSAIASAIRASSARDERRRILHEPVLGAALLQESRRVDAMHVSADRPALIQFTSGSTSRPKGVVVDHRALLANAQRIGATIGFDARDDIVCSWLPLFHDMGLIGHVVVPLLWNQRTVLIPPEKFIMQPRVWLEAISRYGATVSTAPNFAYDLCTAKIRDRDLDGIDLSSWRVAMCGGEPVLAGSLERFTARFANVGFEERALLPVYGLAESSLAATLGKPGAETRVDRIDREVFQATGRAQPYAGEPALRFVGVGSALPEHDLRIVADDGTVCPDRVEGAIQVTGPSSMQGYFEDPDSTAQAFDGRWLRTGDRGYLVDGELFVTGRDKEVIIKAGRNIYPYDVETAAGSVEGIRAGRCAAFGVLDEDQGTERFVLVCEIQRHADQDEGALERAAMAAAFDAAGVRPDDVVLVEPGTLSKTSSGKMQRGVACDRYLRGDFRPPKASVRTLGLLWADRALRRLGISRDP